MDVVSFFRRNGAETFLAEPLGDPESECYYPLDKPESYYIDGKAIHNIMYSSPGESVWLGE